MDLHWSAGFVGIPFSELGRTREGADCWGLACVVYRERLGVDLPEYQGAYVSVSERQEIAALIARVTATSAWRTVKAAHRPFDICVFRRGRLGSHIGVVIEPGRMLHMVEDGQSRIEDYRSPRWAAKLAGVYRHRILGI